MTLLSIIMSVYNESDDELCESIESILLQSYTSFEFIIINDNPKNNRIVELLNFFSDKDKRIKVYNNEKNIGLSASLNKALNYSSGKFVARMDADDISLKDRLEIQMNFLKRNPEVSLVSTNCIYIDETGRKIGEKGRIPTSSDDISKLLPIGSSIIHPSVIMKKEDIINVGGYRAFRMSEDYDLWLRMTSRNYLIASIDQPLIEYRIRKNSMTQSKVYLKVLMDKYMTELYYEREKNNVDSFSEKSLENFLENNKYSDDIFVKKFDINARLFNISIQKLKEKKISLSNLFRIFCFYLKEKNFRFMVNRFIRYQITVKKMK